MDNSDALATSGIQDTDDDKKNKTKTKTKTKHRKLERRERDDLNTPPLPRTKKLKHEVELRCSQWVGSSYVLTRYTLNF